MEKAGKRIITKFFEKLLLRWHFDDNSLKKKQTLWPLFMDGVQPPQG